ncbi:hypothetical protein EUGRSUZ_K00357 [Eucalyptus grandis]|uniref:Uncharacterized protein n=2 Tax=Eucalyptus grandis TaxID=71139 RepID=A0ACC3IQ14_EUCGR|nr:hypothetical protein EUGRSUZ_K00357 [Eucalyptus grandis]
MPDPGVPPVCSVPMVVLAPSPVDHIFQHAAVNGLSSSLASSCPLGPRERHGPPLRRFTGRPIEDHFSRPSLDLTQPVEKVRRFRRSSFLCRVEIYQRRRGVGSVSVFACGIVAVVFFGSNLTWVCREVLVDERASSV